MVMGTMIDMCKSTIPGTTQKQKSERIRMVFGVVSILFLLLLICDQVTSLSSPAEHGNSRRQWLLTATGALSGFKILPQSLQSSQEKAIAAVGGGSVPYLIKEYYNNNDDNSIISTNPQAGRFYFPTLTPPFFNRATYRYTLGRNAWAFEQLLAFANVTATIRCNVIQLESTGGLWVHSPQWPTGEFCSLLEELNAPIEHIGKSDEDPQFLLSCCISSS